MLIYNKIVSVKISKSSRMEEAFFEAKICFIEKKTSE